MMRPCIASILLLQFVLHSVAVGQRVIPKKVSIGDNITLHYAEQGTGPPIIFIHGLTGDYSIWLRQLDAFAERGFRAIAYSRRYNYPNENQLRPNHSASVEAQDLAALMRALDLPKAHLVGHSYGAYTALLLTLNEPELVQTLTLCEAPIVPWLSDLPEPNSVAGKTHLRKLMNEGVKPARAAFGSGEGERGFRIIFDCIAGQQTFTTLPAFVRNRCLRNIREVEAIMTSAVPYPMVDRKLVSNLAIPTLILSGSASKATAKLTDPELARLVPDEIHKRVALEGATHIMWIEQPVQSREAVLDFIRGQ